MAARVLRVLLFCRCPSLSSDVETIISGEPDLRWMGAYDGVGDVISLCSSDGPDVLVIDSRSDPDWKLCLVATGLFPKLKVVVLLDGDHTHPIDAAWVLLHRASSIVGVTARPDRLRMAVRGTVRFGRYVDPDEELPVIPPPDEYGLRGKPLTTRELEVLQLIAEGMTAEKIAHRLSISAGTVRSHTYRLLRKLNARDRAHAVALSFRMSLLSIQHSAGPPDQGFSRPN